MLRNYDSSILNFKRWYIFIMVTGKSLIHQITAARLLQWEYYILCLLAISLPIIEVTKNLASVLLLVVYILHFVMHRKSLTRNILSHIILIFLLCSVVAAVGASINGYDSGKINDIIRYGLTGWIISQLPLQRRQVLVLLALLLSSCLVGIAHAYYHLHEGSKYALELQGVGYSNHTAIYLALILGLSASLLFMKPMKPRFYVAMVIAIIVIIISIFESSSRATLIPLTFITLTSLTLLLFINKKLTILAAIALTIGGMYIIHQPPSIIQKALTKPIISDEQQLMPRIRLWHVNYYMWKHAPIFGIGYGNHANIDADLAKNWFPEVNFHNEKLFYFSSHAHNRYLNTLVEGGIVGLIGLLCLFIGLSYQLAKHILKQHADSLPFYLIVTYTLLTNMLVGFFNTTLHHEHGLLTMMLICLCYRYIINNHRNTTT